MNETEVSQRLNDCRLRLRSGRTFVAARPLADFTGRDFANVTARLHTHPVTACRVVS